MKIKILLFCLFIFSSVYSQTDGPNCSFVLDPLVNNCDEEFTHSTEQVYLDGFEPVVFNIYFWEFRRDDGSLDANATPMDFEKESLDVIAALNIFYNPYNVFLNIMV